ncbi:MAG: ABC transporter permease [Clostridia bacterium]|nr:ABC transporter permease [Clostridia bacterium]MBR3595533.1 ABC transporter permease [Clostridia bacterium]
MKKITNQIIYNLKKEKSSFVSFGVIILITALILNCAAVLLSQVDRAYEEKLSSLNTADVNVIVPRIQSSSKLENNLRDLSSVEKLESHTAVMVEATVKDFNGADFSMNTVFYNMDAKRNVNNFELVSESKNDVENPIYIPLYVSDFGGFDLGDNIVYAIDGKSHSFTVAGVIEEMQYGNYGSGLLCAYLPKEDFEEFADVYSEKTVVEYSMSVNSGASLDKTKEDISKVIEHNGVMTLSLLDSESVKGARTMVTDLLILILTAFSLIILAVSVFLSNFKVKNAIDCEIINMSVLKALGYTSAQIVWGITLPYALVSLIFALSGVGLSYALLPVLCSVLTVQSGFSFAVSFDLLSFICVTVILVGVVTFFTFISARKIKKTQPIDGLRGNTSTKGAKKNRLPLDKTKGNTKLLLVLKQMIATKKQNVMLFLVSFVLTVLIAFSGTLFYNVVVKPENFMSALSDEVADVIMIPKEDSISKLEAKLGDDNRVENSLQYMSCSVKIEDKAVTSFACEDFSKVRNDVCYMGTNPKEIDEIALGSAFEESFKIGDTVSVTVDDITKSFEVTGFVQSVNLQGEICQLSTEGYNSLLDEKQTPSLYVYLENPENAEEVVKEYKADYPELLADTINSYKLQKEAQDMYMGITMVLVVAIFVVTILVVLFILYIVIKSLLVKRRQELGIYKAMGYTSSQLISQTAGSFMLVSIIATLLSSVLAMFYMPAVYGFIFEALGVMKNNIEISFGFLMLFAVAVILVNIIISIILCMPIRKISAYSLIKE